MSNFNVYIDIYSWSFNLLRLTCTMYLLPVMICRTVVAVSVVFLDHGISASGHMGIVSC